MKTTLSVSTRAIVGLLLLVGCNAKSDTLPQVKESNPTSISPSAIDNSIEYSATHKLVYVPTYSHIYTQDDSREFDLAATLSVRNTDPSTTISISNVTYYDSAGKLVRSYVEEAISLGPLASRSFVVAESDRTGGVGANFIVEWSSTEEVSEPVVEAVLIGTKSSQGISFVSRGVVVRPILQKR